MALYDLIFAQIDFLCRMLGFNYERKRIFVSQVIRLIVKSTPSNRDQYSNNNFLKHEIE